MATLGSDTITPGSFARQDTLSDPGAPTDSSLAPPPLPQRADSRPDFVRGFGIEIPEEEEPPEDVVEASHVVQLAEDQSVDMELDEDETQEGSVTTAAHSRLHSRHVSRLSAALSLLSVGGQVDVEEPERRDMDQVPLHQVPLRHGANAPEVDDLDGDAVGEWTGSEDMRTGAESEEDEVRNTNRDGLVFTTRHLSHSSAECALECLYLYHLRRASASGQIPQTKSEQETIDFNEGLCARAAIANDKARITPTIARSKLLEDFLASLFPLLLHLLTRSQTPPPTTRTT